MVLSLLSIETSYAALIFGTNDSSGHFVLLPADDPRFKVAYQVMMLNQWPTPEEQKEMARDSSHPHANKSLEEDFIQYQIKKECHSLQLDCKDVLVKWIPPTYWDLVQVSHSIGSAYKENPNIVCLKGANQDLLWKDHELTTRYFHCMQSLVLENLNRQGPVSTDQLNDLDFVNRSDSLILEIEKNATARKNPQILLQFKTEINLAKNNQPHLFREVIRQEILTHSQNKALVWRASDGYIFGELLPQASVLTINTEPEFLPLIQEAQNESTIAPNSPLLGGISPKGCSTASPNENKCAEVNQRIKPHLLERLVDFPLKFREKDGVTEVEFKDLSFSHSILAAYMVRDQDCSFCYMRPLNQGKRSFYLYALNMDRALFNHQSKYRSFAVGNRPSWGGVFERWELFHPRTGFFDEEDVPSNNYTFRRKKPPTQSEQMNKGLLIAELLAGSDMHIVEMESKENQLKKARNDLIHQEEFEKLYPGLKMGFTAGEYRQVYERIGNLPSAEEQIVRVKEAQKVAYVWLKDWIENCQKSLPRSLR